MKCNVNGIFYIIPLQFYALRRIERQVYFECRICGRSDFERKQFIWHVKVMHEQVMKVSK